MKVAEYTGPKTELEPDAGVMLRHLELLFGHEIDGKFDLCWIDVESGVLNKHKLFYVSDIDEAAEYAANINKEPGASVYIRPAVLKPETLGAVSDKDFLHSVHAWCDFDDNEATLNAHNIYSMARPNFVVRTGKVANGGECHRAHCYWRLAYEYDEFFEDGETLREVNSRIAKKLNADPATVNPTRMMRLAGSINWPWKPGRVPEFCDLFEYGDRPLHSINDLKDAFPATTQTPRDDPASQRDQTRDLMGRNRDAALIEKIKAGDNWHNHTCRLVATYIAKGVSEEAIIAMAPALTLEGWTVADTERDLKLMIDGARRKGFAPDKPAPFMPGEPPADHGPAILSPLKIYFIDDATDPVVDCGVVGDLFYLGDLVFISGASNAGKSAVAVTLAHSIQNGIPFCDYQVDQYNVLYLSPERGGRDIHNRFVGLRDLHGGDPIALCPSALTLWGEVNHAAEIIQEAKRMECKIVFVDTQAAAMRGADRNAYADGGTFLTACKAMQDAGLTVIVCTHPPKAQSSPVAGIGDFEGNSDCVLVVTNEVDEDAGETIRKMIVHKSKGGAQGKEHHFDLNILKLGENRRGEDVTGAVANFKAKPMIKQSPLQRLSTDELTAVRVTVNQAFDNGKPFTRTTRGTRPLENMLLSTYPGKLSRPQAQKIIADWYLNGVLVDRKMKGKNQLGAYFDLPVGVPIETKG